MIQVNTIFFPDATPPNPDPLIYYTERQWYTLVHDFIFFEQLGIVCPFPALP